MLDAQLTSTCNFICTEIEHKMDLRNLKINLELCTYLQPSGTSFSHSLLHTYMNYDEYCQNDKHETLTPQSAFNFTLSFLYI